MHIVSCFAFHLYQILTSTENGSGKIIEAGKKNNNRGREKRTVCMCVWACMHTCGFLWFWRRGDYDSISFTFSMLKNSWLCSRYKERGDYKIVKKLFSFYLGVLRKKKRQLLGNTTYFDMKYIDFRLGTPCWFP